MILAQNVKCDYSEDSLTQVCAHAYAHACAHTHACMHTNAH